MAGIVFAPGIGSLAGAYDAFLIDQWGVLHHGRPAAAASLRALEAVRRAGKQVAILTNSGRRAADNRKRLASLGFSADLYDVVVSSGELAWRHLAERTIPWLGEVGRSCLFFSHEDPAFLEGLDLVPVNDPDAADFVLAVGVDAARRSFADYERILDRAWRRRLRMICANADLTAFNDGRPVYGCGALAARYAEWGGEVTYFGKPHPEIFHAAIAALHTPGRVLVVGDSLIHDIDGARRAGLDSALVLDGVHARDLSELDESAEAAVRILCGRHRVEPNYALPAFRW